LRSFWWRKEEIDKMEMIEMMEKMEM